MASVIVIVAGWLAGSASSTVWAQMDFDQPPIRYSSQPATDRAAELKKQIEAGERKLAWHDKHGWLPALLEALKTPVESQTLVFSKTSMQFARIDPARPRAIYFNDDVYVGTVRGGDIEIAAVDVELGATFYRVRNRKADRPAIIRDQGDCLSCHQSSRTKGVPGFLVRSVYPESSGQPSYRMGTVTTDHTTPLLDRFGGWYVTGEHGEMRHRGNVFVANATEDPLDRDAGANRKTLPQQVDSSAYLHDGSDIVALMVLEHQTQLHNLVTKVVYAEKQAMHYQDIMNKALERPEGFLSESTTRRIESAAEKLVEYLFFCDEFALKAPVQGAPGFQRTFIAMGPRDSQGRSLRELDLNKRMFRYPCSYLIYTESFRNMPPLSKAYVRKRMQEVLRGQDSDDRFAHLGKKQREAIWEILQATHPWFQDAVQAPTDAR